MSFVISSVEYGYLEVVVGKETGGNLDRNILYTDLHGYYMIYKQINIH